jgi:hypothetical protein
MQVGQRASCHMAKEVQQHLRISNLLEWNDVLRSRWGMGAGWVSVDTNKIGTSGVILGLPRYLTLAIGWSHEPR